MFVHVFLLLSMYTYCCLRILRCSYPDWGFACFFLGCKANARVILAKTGHGPHSSKIVVLFYVLFILYCSCVNVYCHRVTTQLQLKNISYKDYSQVFTTACFWNLFVTKGVTQWIFNLSSHKSYCLTFTRICFHPIFYHPFPQGVQILLQIYMSFLFVIFLYIIQSSAKSLISKSMFLQKSFTSGVLPCSTPEVTLTSFDSCPPTVTLCIWPTRNSLTQRTTLESTPEVTCFVSSQPWGTKSKTLLEFYYNRIYTDPLVRRVRYVLAHYYDLNFTRVSRSKPMLSLV